MPALPMLILPLFWLIQVTRSLKLLASMFGRAMTVMGTSLIIPRYSKSLSTLKGTLRRRDGMVAMLMWCSIRV